MLMGSHIPSYELPPTLDDVSIIDSLMGDGSSLALQQQQMAMAGRGEFFWNGPGGMVDDAAAAAAAGGACSSEQDLNFTVDDFLADMQGTATTHSPASLVAFHADVMLGDSKRLDVTSGRGVGQTAQQQQQQERSCFTYELAAEGCGGRLPLPSLPLLPRFAATGAAAVEENCSSNSSRGDGGLGLREKAEGVSRDSSFSSNVASDLVDLDHLLSSFSPLPLATDPWGIRTDGESSSPATSADGSSLLRLLEDSDRGHDSSDTESSQSGQSRGSGQQQQLQQLLASLSSSSSSAAAAAESSLPSLQQLAASPGFDSLLSEGLLQAWLGEGEDSKALVSRSGLQATQEPFPEIVKEIRGREQGLSGAKGALIKAAELNAASQLNFQIADAFKQQAVKDLCSSSPPRKRQTIPEPSLPFRVGMQGNSRPGDMSARLAAVIEKLNKAPSLATAAGSFASEPKVLEAVKVPRVSRMLRGSDAHSSQMVSPSSSSSSSGKRGRAAADGTLRPKASVVEERFSGAEAVRPSLGHLGMTPPHLVKGWIIELAEATAVQEEGKVRMLQQRLRREAIDTGTSTQRLTHYFLDALTARASGTGAERYNRALQVPMHEMAMALEKCFQHLPYVDFCCISTINCMLSAISNHRKIHLVAFQILVSRHWLSFFQQLAMRPGGPPHVRITAIDVSCGNDVTDSKASAVFGGRMLSKLAAGFGVPFSFSAIGARFNTFTTAMVRVDPEEALLAAFNMSLCFFPDDSVIRSNPRDSMLRWLRELSPLAVCITEINAAFNSPFFLTRVKEALRFFGAAFDSLDATLARDAIHRLNCERMYFGRDIINVIACEGLLRTVRAETFDQWRARFQRVGFFPMPFDAESVHRLANLTTDASGHHSNFEVKEVNGGVMLHWKKEPIMSASSWKCSA